MHRCSPRDEELGATGLVTDYIHHASSPPTSCACPVHTIASQVAAAIDISAGRSTKRVPQRDVVEALRRTTNALSRSLDQVKTGLATILQQLRHVLEYEGAAIALVHWRR